MINLYNVTKQYANGVTAVNNVTAKIGKGEFVFLVGASGAGKTSLIKMLYLEERPTRGYIIVDGYNIMRLKNREIPYFRRNIGVVFQDFKLLPEKTAYENVAFALEAIGTSPREIQKRVPTVLELVGLKHRMQAYPHQMSGGEQQRVAVARAIVNNPAVIVADEPTGNLDPETSWEIMRLFNEINKLGATIVVATHDQAIVDRMQKRVIALENGTVVRDEEKGGYHRAKN
jgi:cell division transport system ATP-binding protein